MATLKISDLSVGDWVKVYIANKERYCRVEEIRWNIIIGRYVVNICDSKFSLLESYLHPIPLTPEILEKNGLFRHKLDNDNPECIVLSNHFMMARTYSDVDWWRILIYDEEIPSEELFSGIVYSIHELQHALRLAGVDKEINL